MTRTDVVKIVTRRLGRWSERLVTAHSTPFVLVGVGHDHRTGQVVLCTCEDVTDAQIAATLRAAAEILDPEGRTC